LRVRLPHRFVALAAIVVSTIAILPMVPARAETTYQPGAAGLGDPYFPLAGNGGYDAVNYHLDLAYAPVTNRLTGTVTMTARAVHNLSRFNLDLQGMSVTGVTVNGLAATFARDGQELLVSPANGIDAGQQFFVAVQYAGTPQPLGGPIVFGLPYGWLDTDDGAFVATEPNAPSTWFPSNDHLSDKATYQIRVSVPEDLFVASNGKLVTSKSQGGRTTFVWEETHPAAPHTVTACIGKFAVQQGTTGGGIPNLVAIDPNFPIEPGAPDLFSKTGEVVDYWSSLFGPYPFEWTGGILDNLPDTGYSLETQSRPIYTVLNESVIAHELAHQWFADAVTPRTWQDIWLNEGFATYAQWLWSEHTGVRSLHDSLLRNYNSFPADDPFWQVKVGDPGRDTMFHAAVYVRGAMALQVLRETVGDTAFLNLLRTWFATYKYRNVSTEDFIAMANRITGQDVKGLMNTWLYTTGRPALP
jgi:aminopeptidase N